MNKEKYKQIIDVAYVNYKHYFENKYGNYITGRITKEDSDYLIVNKHPLPQETILSIIYSKEEFIRKCKTDPEFSKKWGLKIEERELSLEERGQWCQDFLDWDLVVGNLDHDHIREDVEENAPTKLITVTYKDEKTEIYE